MAQAGSSQPNTTPGTFPKAKPIDPARVQQHGRAKVWKFYNHHPITMENACKACGHKTNDQKTFNLENHLKQHPGLYEKLGKKASTKQDERTPTTPAPCSSQNTVRAAFERGAAKYGRIHPMQERLTRLMAHAYAESSIPYHAAEKKFMKKFLTTLNTQFDVPNRRQLRALVVDAAQALRIRVRNGLDKIDKVRSSAIYALTKMHILQVHVLMDVWSKRSLSESFLGVVGVGFNPETQTTQSYFLGCKSLPSPHTGDRINEQMLEVLTVSRRCSFFISVKYIFMYRNGTSILNVLGLLSLMPVPTWWPLSARTRTKTSVKQNLMRTKMLRKIMITFWKVSSFLIFGALLNAKF